MFRMDLLCRVPYLSESFLKARLKGTHTHTYTTVAQEQATTYTDTYKGR
jgi:hypothetical protein